METLSRHRIRILGDSSNPYADPQDILKTGNDKTVRIPRGGDLQIEMGLTRAGAMIGTGNLASLTAEIKSLRQGQYAPEDEALPLATSTTATLLDVSLEDFNAGEEANHSALLTLDGGETANIPDGPRWLVVYALTTDNPGRKIFFVAGKIEAENMGQGGTVQPLDPSENHYTDAQADARFQSRFPVASAPLTNSSPGTTGDWFYDEATNRYFECVATSKWIIHARPVDTFDHSV